MTTPQPDVLALAKANRQAAVKMVGHAYRQVPPDIEGLAQAIAAALTSAVAAQQEELRRLREALDIAVNRIEASLQDCRNGIRIAELTDDGPLKQKCIAAGLDLERLLEKIRRAQQPSGEG
jgi:uncharacterized coiled-coil protein SlyX